MKSKIRPLVIVLLSTLLSFQATVAQQINKDVGIDPNNLPHLIEFKAGIKPNELSEVLKKELDCSAESGLLSVGSKIQDELGLDHQRFKQLYNDVPVFGSSISTHGKNGLINSINGTLLQAVPQKGLGSTIGLKAALESAKLFVGAEEYMWESDEMEAFIKREQNNPDATFSPQIQTVYYPLSFPLLKGELRLAYQMDIYAKFPLSRQNVIVDAYTGEVLASYERIHEINETGTAETAFSGNQSIVTYRPNSSSNFQLLDLSRGGGIRTYDCMDSDN